jgi:hypothetical protein
MNTAKINRGLAELMGWSTKKVRVSGLSRDVPLWFGPQGENNRSQPPDFCHDLNAIHAALMRLSPETRAEFRRDLQYAIAPDTRPKGSGVKVMGQEHYDEWWHAPAQLRAEVLYEMLKTKKRRCRKL